MLSHAAAGVSGRGVIRGYVDMGAVTRIESTNSEDSE